MAASHYPSPNIETTQNQVDISNDAFDGDAESTTNIIEGYTVEKESFGDIETQAGAERSDTPASNLFSSDNEEENGGKNNIENEPPDLPPGVPEIDDEPPVLSPGVPDPSRFSPDPPSDIPEFDSPIKADIQRPSTSQDNKKVSPLKIPTAKIKKKRKKKKARVVIDPNDSDFEPYVPDPNDAEFEPSKAVKRPRKSVQVQTNYQCKLCNFIVKREAGLWHHLSTHYQLEDQEKPWLTEEKNVYKCLFCDKKGPFNGMKVHFFKEHKRNEIFIDNRNVAGEVNDIKDLFTMRLPSMMELAAANQQ